MLTFLEETLNHIKKKNFDVSSLTIILPSKRSGGFLLNYLKKTASQTSFSPKIISIEEFIEDISGQKIVSPTELLFKSYEAYLKTPSKQEKDEFDVFSTWANTLLNDFNEIDRYLIPSRPFFNYLSSIQDINHWYVKSKKTQLIENYLAFWESLQDFYEKLYESLLNDEIGYQGMVYREAAENIEHYIASHIDKKYIFIGFNALNNAEQNIVQELLETGNAEIYWDVDSHFYQDKKHSASYFLRKYVSEWNFFNNQIPDFISNNYNKEKKIKIVEVQRNIGQAKFIGQHLSKLSKKELNNTAIVLADENLLQPVLQSLPSNLESINVTMGVSLNSFPAVVFFELLLSLHINPSRFYYYKNILSILNHPLTSKLLTNSKEISNNISKENITHLPFSRLLELNGNKEEGMLRHLFDDWNDKSSIAIMSCIEILTKLKTDKESSRIEQVVYYNLYTIFKNIKKLNKKFKYLKTIKTVQSLFSELISTTTLDFKGDAYNGLQVMGVLETRVLDFENIIISSVNEGIFPSGKSNASFITYDLKQQFGLPTYTEKDAIYTYHFYRLLHRAKNITLLYNNFSEGLNTGEKSRFISQLEIENISSHTFEKNILTPTIPISKSQLKKVDKTEGVLTRLKEIASHGFSPSTLTSYLRNPLDFYYQKILKINEFKEVEETVAANTLGTIVHDTLEAFYKPLENSFLTIDVLHKMQQKIEKEITKQFIKTFKEGDFSKGKNLLVFEVAKRFVLNFINYEISEIKKGNEIKILKIESDLVTEIPIKELEFPIKIKGIVDRVDEYNGILRIIDYKTGLVNQTNLNIVAWEDLVTDNKYSKIIQVLAYAKMIHNDSPFENAEAGIISFKNLNSGFLKFTKREKPRGGTTNSFISGEILTEYSEQLKNLILEIFNQKIPFTEKEV